LIIDEKIGGLSPWVSFDSLIEVNYEHGELRTREKAVEKQTSHRNPEQEKTLAEMYRRGYHHGFNRAREILLRLLKEGMPASVALELCRVFEAEVLVPWRMDTSMSSAPPVFDVEESQQQLRADKERQSDNQP
jgi:hypothetical protein